MPFKCQSRTGASFATIAIILLIVLLVASVTYSLYLLIDLTHVSNVANVHISKNLLLASKNAQGKLYNNAQAGIANWIVYADKENGFELKYPNDAAIADKAGENCLLILKKYNIASQKGVSSIAMVIHVDQKAADTMTVRAALKEKGISWDNNWQQAMYGGKPGVRTGQIKDNSGVVKDIVVWQLGGKIYTLEADYLNSDKDDEQELFNKIVAEFKFI